MLWTLGRRACLIVPVELWPDLEEDQQMALMTHELAHLKRGDHWVRWLDLVVTGLYWWHPVVWLARRGLREAEELCCDAWAVWAAPQGARRYASALLTALEFVSGASTTDVAAAAAVVSGRRHVSCLKGRMQMIVQAKTPRRLSAAGRLGMLVLAILTLPLAVTWAQNADSARSETDRDSERQTIKPEGRERRGDWEDNLNATGVRSYDLEISLDDLVKQLGLKDRVQAEALREKVNKDPEVAPLLDQIKQQRERMQNFSTFARNMDDPAYVAANEQLRNAEREYLKLWEKKSHAEATRLKAQAKDKEVDDDEDNDRMEASSRLQRLLKDLGEKLSKDIGPLSEEVSKALEKSAKEVSEAIEKNGVISKELREALKRARDELHDAFKEGGSFNQEAREALEKARKDMSESVEKVRQELREAARKRADEAREAAQERLRSLTKEKDEEVAQEAAGGEKSNEVEQARHEVRQIEQQLRRAIRHLEAIERHEQRLAQGLHHGPAVPPNSQARPKPLETPDGPESRSTSPPASETSGSPAGLRPSHRPDGAPGATRGPAPSVASPRVERRLRDLEAKMDRLLKEMESLKGDKTEKPKSEKDED
jgi:hypothetical protein